MPAVSRQPRAGAAASRAVERRIVNFMVTIEVEVEVGYVIWT
jgi:hypothetical protein